MFRFYGPEKAVFDHSWALPDIAKAHEETPHGHARHRRELRPRKAILDGSWKFPEAQPVG